MDYEQQLAGRSSHDPSRASYRARPEANHRARPEGGTGGVVLIVAVIVAVLAVAFWLAGSPQGGDGGAPAADSVSPAPLPGAAETAAPPLINPEPAAPPAGSPAPADQ